jgi:hypothetical protein
MVEVRKLEILTKEIAKQEPVIVAKGKACKE